MLLRGSRGGGVAATFTQVLKIVFPMRDVALDKGVPTSLTSAVTLGT